MFHGIIIFLSALIVRIILAEKMPIDFDEAWYLANSSLAMDGLVPYRDFFGRSPLLLYMLGAINKLAGPDIIHGRLVSVISSSLSSVLIYAIARRYFSPCVAVASGLLYALSPFTVRYGYIAVTEPVSLLFVLASIHFFLIGMEDDIRRYFLISGIALSCAVLVRRSSAIYLAALPLFYLAFSFRKEPDADRSLKSRLLTRSTNSFLFVTGFSVVFLSGLFFLLNEGNMKLVLSMYDVRELWKYAYLDKTIIWNIKELSYQMLYFALFFVIFISALMKRYLNGNLYCWFLALTATMGIFSARVFLPVDGLEGLIASSPQNVAASLLYILVLMGTVFLLARPWDDLFAGKRCIKDSFIRLMPLSFPMASIVLSVGMELTNPFLEWMMKAYLLTVLFLVLINLRDSVSKRFGSGNGTQYRAALVVLYLIYMAVASRTMFHDRDVHLLMIGIIIAAVLIFLIIVILSKMKRFSSYWAEKTRWRHLYSAILSIGLVLVILSGILFSRRLGLMGGRMSVFYIVSLILGYATAFIIGNNIASFKVIKESVLNSKKAWPKAYVISIPPFIAAVPFLFYFLRSWWMPIYFFEMAPGLCIISGIVIISLFSGLSSYRMKIGKSGCSTSVKRTDNRKKNRFPLVRAHSKRIRYLAAVLFIIISLILPVCMYAVDPYDIYLGHPSRHPTPDLVRQVGELVKKNTSPNEEIFAWPVYAFQSDRRVIFDITHSLLYQEYVGTDEIGLEIFNYPTVREIMDYMEETEVRLVVVDDNIRDVFFTYRDYFREYIYTEYNLLEDYGTIEILVRSC